ncbi:hypothetical protein GLR48_01360 [Loktanella sp. M215]|nr:hypothetical protein [Loktanella sp. M215]
MRFLRRGLRLRQTPSNPLLSILVECTCFQGIEAHPFATQWLWTYNNDRPNMGIGGITSAVKMAA